MFSQGRVDLVLVSQEIFAVDELNRLHRNGQA